MKDNANELWNLDEIVDRLNEKSDLYRQRGDKQAAANYALYAGLVRDAALRERADWRRLLASANAVTRQLREQLDDLKSKINTQEKAR